MNDADAARKDRADLRHVLALEAHRADTPAAKRTMWGEARQALSDAQHAGDPQYAARILMACAAKLAAYDHAWSVVRPPLGVPRTEQDKAA